METPKLKHGLIVEWMEEEALIYCPDSQQALCLNPVCSKVFSLCDGSHTPAQIASTLWGHYSEITEEAVEVSLTLLNDHGLLKRAHRFQRREILALASTLIPTVLAIGAPTPAMASSQTCLSNIECGSNPFLCNPCDFSSTGHNCQPNQFCMKTYHVRVDGSGNPFPGDTCLADSDRGLVPNCEPEQASGVWHRSCGFARSQAIARWVARGRVGSIDDYKCCNRC